MKYIIGISKKTGKELLFLLKDGDELGPEQLTCLSSTKEITKGQLFKHYRNKGLPAYKREK